MQQIINEILGPDVTLASAIFKLLLGLVLGASIGLERRRKGQIAGLRTFALISMGATLAMLISIYIPQEYMGLKNGDPGRIAALVISGVGFLGAGAIIQMKGSVRGLTTAAGIWMAACIGLAVGAGMFTVAIVATLLIIFILVNIERIEMRTNFLWEAKIIRIKARGIVDDFDICFVTIGSNYAATVEITSLLKDLGAKKIVVKAGRDGFDVRSVEDMLHPRLRADGVRFLENVRIV